MVVYSCFFLSSRRRHTICALVTGVQTCALPICQQRNLGHEPESTVKIIEAEAARDRISLRIIDPAGQIGESFLPFLFGQLRNHGNAPVWTFRMARLWRTEEHTSELQSLRRTSYAVFCLKKKQ